MDDEDDELAGEILQDYLFGVPWLLYNSDSA